MRTASRAAACLAAALCAGTPLYASPNRVAALGGEARFLVDAVNVHDYPALAVSLGHAGVEIFDDWGGAVVPVGPGGAGLFLNRPAPHLAAYNAWLDTAGTASLASLEVQPWAAAVAGLDLGGDRALGLAVAYAADLEDSGRGEATASVTDVALGLRLGPPARRLDLTARLRRFRLRDEGVAPALRQSDGDLLGVEARLRWAVRPGVRLVPILSVESGALGLEPGSRDVRHGSLGLAALVQPAPAILALAGVLVEYDQLEERAPGQTPLDQWSASLPAVVGGAEARVGSMVVRAGLRHEVRHHRAEAAAAGDQVLARRTTDAGLRTDVGLGLEFGNLRVDGVLEKDFLRDGPHFLGGSRRGGGIFANLSLEYVLGP